MSLWKWSKASSANTEPVLWEDKGGLEPAEPYASYAPDWLVARVNSNGVLPLLNLGAVGGGVYCRLSLQL